VVIRAGKSVDSRGGGSSSFIWGGVKRGSKKLEREEDSQMANGGRKVRINLLL